MRLAAFALMFLTAISTFKEGYGFWDIYRREAVGTMAWRVYLLARFVGGKPALPAAYGAGAPPALPGGALLLSRSGMGATLRLH